MNPHEGLDLQLFQDVWKAPDRKPGLKPRKWKVGQRCPIFGERMKTIPEREWADKIQEGATGSKGSVHFIYDQNGVGSCGAESANDAHMIVRASRGDDRIVFSPWATYHFTSGGVDRGSSVDENLDSMRSRGSVPMDLWPRDKGWRKRPSEEALDAALNYKILEFYDITSREEFATALLQGFPVCYGRASHAITAIELIRDRNKWLVKYVNSWGKNWTDCGDPGYGIDALDKIRWQGYGAYAVRTATSLYVPPTLSSSVCLFEPMPVIAT